MGKLISTALRVFAIEYVPQTPLLNVYPITYFTFSLKPLISMCPFISRDNSVGNDSACQSDSTHLVRIAILTTPLVLFCAAKYRYIKCLILLSIKKQNTSHIQVVIMVAADYSVR